MNEKFIEENENIINKEKIETFELKEKEEKEKKEEKIKTDTEEYTDSNKDLDQLIFKKRTRKNCYKFLFYYEFFISIFLLINSFISFCFLNILHLFYSYFCIYNMYSTSYSFRIMFEKYISFVIVFLDEIYLVLKGSVHLYITSRKEKPNYDNELLKSINIYEDNWRTIYDYVMNSIIVVMIIIKMIFKGYDKNYFNNNDLNDNIKSIEKHLKNNSNILIMGIIILSFGSSFCPSIINLTILIVGFVFFLSRIINKKLKKLSKQYLKYFFMLIIILSTLYNYIFSNEIILEKLFVDNNISYYYGITKIFEKNNKNNSVSLNISAIFNFTLFYISFFLINLHTKCMNYINNQQKDKFIFNSLPLNEKDSEPLKLKNEKEKIIVEGIFSEEFKNISLNGTFYPDKEQIKMQALFNFDMDCWIILFLKNSKKEKFLKKIKLFLLNFCYSTGFSLHACRLSFIFWINYFNIYYESYLIIIWILFSIRHSGTKIFYYFTKYIIYPFFIAIYFIYYVVNIIDEKISSINIEPEKDITKRVINSLIRITVIFLVQMFVNLHSIQLKNLEDKEIKNIIRKHQKKIEQNIIKEFKGNYIVEPIEIFFKLYFILVDIFIIVFIYLSVSQKINLFNELILVSLIFFLIKGESFKKYMYIFFIILTFSFLLKYTIYLFDLNKNNTFKAIINILINDDLYKIYYLWISFYLLFLEYIGQRSKIFKLFETKNFSMYEIIEFNFASFTYFRFILNILFNFIFGIYIWLLIPCFISCLLVFDNNCLSLFELTIVFIIYYKYIRIVNMKFKTIEQIYKYTRILIFTNIIYLILEYIVQFLNNSEFLMMIFLSYPNQKFIKIMELIGFFLFKGNYQNNLLSSFMMFILSLALHIEIHRQQGINTKDSSHKSEIEKYSLLNAINKFSFLRTNSESSENNDLNSKLLNNENNNYQKERMNELSKRIKDNEKMKKIIHKIFNLLYYILHYYWIIIFIFEVALSIHWMLSISMIIQLSIFSYFMAKSFNEYYKCLKSQEVVDKRGIKNYKKKTLNQKLKLYKIEQRKHFKITSKIQHSYFSLIWIFTFSFIVLSYLTNIIQKSINISEGNQKLTKYINAVTYFLGVYSQTSTEVNNYGFWSYTWGYFITIGLFSVRAYLMSKFAEIKIKYFNDEEKENNNIINHQNENEIKSKISRQSKILEFELNNKINKLEESNITESSDISFYENVNNEFMVEENINDNDKIDIKEKDFSYNSKNKNEINIIFKKEEELEKKLNKRIMKNIFKKEYDEYSKLYQENKNNDYNDDINIEYKKNIINKLVESKMSFQLSLKKLIEIIIIILLFTNALIKCNVLSFIYLLIMIPAFKLNLINTYLMFRISFFSLIFLIIQYTLFISNISYTTNPFIDKEIVLNINQIFHLPWYKDYRWSTFFSLGTNRYQIITIWLDVAIILILYFYIEHFSFTVFIEGKKSQDLKIVSKKYNKKFKELKSISNEEYKSFIRAMKVSYDIELIPSFEKEKDKQINEYLTKSYNKTFMKLLYLFKGDKRYLKIKNNSKKSFIDKIRRFIYISFQYLFLYITLLISSFNQGFIAFGYMAFSIYYIYKSNCFLKGRRWTLLNGIRYFMKPYLFFDILTQFIFQIPLDKFKKNEKVFEKFFKIFGYVQIADYSSQTDFISSVSCFIVILKILCAFLLLIQENMYISFDFKKFILKYHYEYMQKTYIKGKLHAFLFNNQRVSLMKDREKENNNVQKNLLKIEKAVNNWNKKLKRYNNDDLAKEDNLYDIANEEIIINKKDNGTTISKILRKHWLISITLKIFAASNHIDDEHYNISGYILKILKGNYVLYSELDNLINEYEEKNYERYNDIKKVQQSLEEYLKIKNDTINEKIDDDKFDNNLDNQKRKRFNSFYLPIKKKSIHKSRRISTEFALENLNLYEKGFNLNNNLNINNYIKEKGLDNNSSGSENNDEIKNKNKEKNKSNNDKDNDNYIKFDQHFDDLFFANSDYQDFKNLIRIKFFNECCSRKKIFLFLLQSIFNYLIEHSEYTIYFFILLYHLLNGKLLSFIYPIFVLIFGIIQYPRPSKIFWKILMVYTTFVIFLKFLIQLNFWELDVYMKNIIKYFDESNEKYIYYLGLKRVPNHDFLLFMAFIFPDFFILILLITNQIILTRKGLWYNTETDYEKIEEANNRIILYNSEKIKNKLNFDENDSKILSSNEILKLIGRARTEQSISIFKRIQKFHQKIFNRLRNEKPGKDFYNYYTFMQITILIYIIFFYTKMEQDSIIYNSNVFQVKQFSANMVIFALIHVFLLTFDRFLYLRNTGKLKKIAYKVYNKNTGEDITYKFKKYKYNDIERYIEMKNKSDDSITNYTLVSYQIEEAQVGLIIKFITQIILVILIHLFIYFYLPYTIRTNPDNNENSSENITISNKNINQNVYISIFYVLYIFYFLFSGLQIKYGFTDIKKISFRERASHFFAYFSYTIFINIPFLFELKNFIDWTFTNTALSLWQWLKLEEIISLLYLNKCYVKAKMIRRVGSIIPNYSKIFFGGLTNLSIIVLIFGPLILFSSLNPINVVNQVNGVNLKIVLCMQVEHKAKINLTLFQTYNSIIQGFKNEQEYSNYLFNQGNDELNTFNKSYKYNQVQRVKLISFSEYNWDISNQFKNYFSPNTNYSKGEYYLSLVYSFITSQNNEASNNYRYEDKFILDNNIMTKLSETINSNITSRADLFLKEFFYPYQRITEDNTPNPLVWNTKKNVNLSLEKTIINNTRTPYNYNWYLNELNQTEKQKATNESIDIEGIEFLTFTDLFSSVIFGYDVITFYITFIFVSGKIIRALFLGQAERIIYTEMVNQTKLFSVCEGIKISRMRKNYLQEEKLYYLLIEMMRSPEMIKNMTQSSLVFIQEDNVVREEKKLKEFEVDSKPLIRKKKKEENN